jgi:hypothetical protein
MAAETRQCDNCGTLAAPRGGATPRFCPTCGQPLPTGAAGPGHHRPGGLEPITPGSAVASLVFGILSLVIPMFGLLIGILAIATGVHAKKHIEESGGRRGGSGMATAGITLGIIGAGIWFLVCAAAL